MPLEVGPLLVPLGRVLREEDGITNGRDLGRTNKGIEEELKPMAVDVG